MATKYQVQIGNEVIEFEGPDGMTDAQIESLGDKVLKDAKPGQEFPHSVYMDPGDQPDVLNTPELPESSAAGSFFRGLPKDALFNFDDELIGFGNALIPGAAALDRATGQAGDQRGFWDSPQGFWDTVKSNIEQKRLQDKADAEQHPVAQGAGRIAGVVSTLPRAGVAIASRLPLAIKTAAAARPVATTVALGGGLGAVSGAGAGEEGTRAQSAAIAGLTGAGLGPATYAAGELAPIVARYGKVFLNKGVTKEGLRQMIQAIDRAGFNVATPEGVQALQTELAQFTGKPVSLADISEATRGRTGVALRTPGRAQQIATDAIRERQAGQGPRLIADVKANVAPRTDIQAMDDALVAQRSSEAEKLRELALYEQGAPGTPLYRGGAEFDPNVTERLPYFTPDREAADTFRLMHQERFGTPGSVQEARVNIRNPAPQDVVIAEAKKLGLSDPDELTPASLLDVELHGSVALDLRDALKAKGYDGTVLDDITYGGPMNDGSLKAHIPFDNNAVAIGAGGRQSRIVDPTRETDPARYQTAVELQNLARLPDAQRALTGALERVNSERDLLAAQGKDISHLPDLGRGSDLDVRAFDYLKRYLDDEVNAIYKRGQGRTFSMAEANQVRSLRDAIRDRLKTFVPEYGDYLDQYAGSSEMIDALREGGDFAKLSPEQISAGQSRRSVAAQELYRAGAGRKLVDDIMETKDTGNAASNILNSPESRLQLEALGVPPENAAALNRSVQQERQLNLLPMELKGSQTQQRLAAEVDAGRDMVPTNVANPWGFVGRLWQHVADSAALRRSEAINAELLPRMTATDPAAISRVIEELSAEGKLLEAAKLRRIYNVNRNAGLGATMIGSPVAMQPQEGY